MVARVSPVNSYLETQPLTLTQRTRSGRWYERLVTVYVFANHSIGKEVQCLEYVLKLQFNPHIQ